MIGNAVAFDEVADLQKMLKAVFTNSGKSESAPWRPTGGRR